MTVAGAAIGIALFVSLTSISKSFTYQMNNFADQHRVDLAVQSKGAVSPMSSRITSEVYERLGVVKGVDETVSVILGKVNVPWNPYLIVMGVSSLEMFTHHIRLLRGQLFEKGKNWILIGVDVAKIGYDVNQKIMLFENEMFAISGIYTSEIKLLNASVIVDMEAARRLISRDDSVNMAFIRLQKGHDQEEVASRINQLLPGLHAVPTGELAGQVLLTKFSEIFSLLISFLTLFAAGIIITNTLLMSIAERTKEIGILMAIGWSRVRITTLILAESLIICVAGMITGNLVGYLILWLIHIINPEGLGWWIAATFDMGVFLTSAGMAVILGMVSAFYPAFVATRLSPVEALRYE